MDEVILTTCPRDCYDACGVAVAVRDGRIRHVRGDRSHPTRLEFAELALRGTDWTDPSRASSSRI
jgi:hypothetical protein